MKREDDCAKAAILLSIDNKTDNGCSTTNGRLETPPQIGAACAYAAESSVSILRET